MATTKKTTKPARSEQELLEAMNELASKLTDRTARTHIRMAIQDVRDWRNGKDRF